MNTFKMTGILLFILLCLSGCADSDLLQTPSENFGSEEVSLIDEEKDNSTNETEDDENTDDNNSNEEPKNEPDANRTCVTSSSKAGVDGLKIWCWGDVEIPGIGFFSNHELFVSSHCNEGMVTNVEDRVFFKVNPTVPAVQDCGSSNYNYRAEIRDAPSDVNHPVGTEQWWGFDYRFEDNYVPDELPWIMWQTHGSFSNPGNPMTSIQLGPTNYADNLSERGELFVSNAAFSTGNPKFTPTGIVPQAGQTLNIVIHLIWGDHNTGRYQVWVDDVLVYDEEERTVYVEQPEGGYWKMGIYKWRWKSESNVNSSASLGIAELNTSIGPLRVIKKSPDNPTYLADEFNTVKPN